MRSAALRSLRTPLTTNLSSHLYKNVCRRISSSIEVNNKSMPKTTVDPVHVKKHSQLVNEWWDPAGPMIALHSFNLLRVPFIRDGLVDCTLEERKILPLQNKNILDVGCGGGLLSEAIARLGANVTGIDASKELIELATEHSHIDTKLANKRPSYYCTTVEDHSKQYTDHYDAVVASEVIEHVSDKELFLKCCIQLTKPGGKIFITTPNKSRLTQFLSICVAEYVVNALPKGTHEYEKFTTPNEVTFLLERNNCHVQIVHGLMYYPVINKWTWCRSPTLQFALQAVKLDDVNEDD